MTALDTARREGRALEPDELDTVRGLVETHGEQDAAEMLTIGRQTIVRALAGLQMQRGSVALIRIALEKLRHGMSVSHTRTIGRESELPPSGNDKVPHPDGHDSRAPNAPDPPRGTHRPNGRKRNT